jgi:hypothetical protein
VAPTVPHRSTGTRTSRSSRRSDSAVAALRVDRHPPSGHSSTGSLDYALKGAVVGHSRVGRRSFAAVDRPFGATVGASAVGAAATGARSIGFAALIAASVGATALGAVAIWRLAIRQVAIREMRIGTLEVDDLTVRRLRVLERD